MEKQVQLKQYKAELTDLMFSGKISGDALNMIRKEIIAVGKKITPTPANKAWEAFN